jgi:C1A family cysteine protease
MFGVNSIQSSWQPDISDPRDLTLNHDRVLEMLCRLPTISERPGIVDRRHECGAMLANAGISSSAHACLDLLTLCESRVTGQRLEPSRLFVHCTARRLARSCAEQADSFRTIWKALVRFGAPTEHEWPSQSDDSPIEPDAFAYSAARDYSSLLYIRLDPRGQAADQTLNIVRWFLAAGFGVVFGFPLCTAISADGAIGFPTLYDVIRGGHAVLAVGYDDQRRVRSDRGSLLVRSCWGRQWGENGYGWLPYRYVQERLAADFWTVLRQEWVDSGEFLRPPLAEEPGNDSA